MNEVESLLHRDITNVLSYFKRYYDVSRDAREIMEVFLAEFVPHNLRNYDQF